MMAAATVRRSCGILLWRQAETGIELWLGHMGGPFWSKKDAGAWSIPKGEPLPAEDELTAALREYEEEMGAPAPAERYERLGDFVQGSGKVVTVFSSQTEVDVRFVGSNDFELEWPPRSGIVQRFPEMDGAAWLPIDAARDKVVKGQQPMIDALMETV